MLWIFFAGYVWNWITSKNSISCVLDMLNSVICVSVLALFCILVFRCVNSFTSISLFISSLLVFLGCEFFLSGHVDLRVVCAGTVACGFWPLHKSKSKVTFSRPVLIWGLKEVFFNICFCLLYYCSAGHWAGFWAVSFWLCFHCCLWWDGNQTSTMCEHSLYTYGCQNLSYTIICVHFPHLNC